MNILTPQTVVIIGGGNVVYPLRYYLLTKASQVRY